MFGSRRRDWGWIRNCSRPGWWAAGRAVRRWSCTPRRDDLALARDESRNNDFEYSDDPHQRRCPYATHIRKVYPRDDAPGGEAEAQRHRIIRRGIPFGPEVEPGETTTRHSRGLMFVCYQIAIARQFEYIQAKLRQQPRLRTRQAAPSDLHAQ